MENFWPDIQETFYLLLGPYIASILLPVFIAAGLLIAGLMSISGYWRPPEKVEVSQDRSE
jgi:hypothetical protein